MPRKGPRKRVTGIGGVFLRSQSPKRLAKWYREHLGMAINSQVVTFEWLAPKRDHRRGATLWAALAPEDKDWGPAHPSAMVNYRVDDLDGLVDQLSEEGIEVEERAEDASAGRFAWVTDPDGNRIELWEPPRSTYRSSDRHVPMS